MVTRATNPVRNSRYTFQGKPSDADVSTAMDEFLQLLDEEDAEGYIPQGDYTMLSMVERTFGATKFGLRGDGRDRARFVIPSSNTDGAFKLDSTSRDNAVTLKDFTIIGQGIHDYGFFWEQPHGGVSFNRSISAENLRIHSADRTTQYFKKYLTTEGAWRPLFDNITLGEAPGGLNREDGSLMYAPTWGLGVDGCYAPHLQDSYIFGANTLVRARVYEATISSVADNGDGTIRFTISNPPHQFQTGALVTIYGTTLYDGVYTATNVVSSNKTQFDITETFAGTATGNATLEQAGEGMFLLNTALNGGRTCWDWKRPAGREPLIFAENVHTNYLVTGWQFNGAKLIQANNCDFYQDDNTGSGTAADPVVDVKLLNASEILFTANTHHFGGKPERQIFQISDDGSAESGQYGKITDCLITCDHETTIVCGAGVSGIHFTGNVLVRAPSSAIGSDTGNANYIQTDLQGRAIEGTWTPVLAFGGGATGITYSTQAGRWELIGNKLHVEIDLVLTAKGSSTGTALIGLPTALPGALAIQTQRGMVEWSDYANMSSLSVPGGIVTTAAGLTLISRTATGVTNMTHGNFTDTSEVRINAVLSMA